jgi:voltage-gated potassium channel
MSDKRTEGTEKPDAQSAVYELFIFALTIFSLVTLVAYFFLPLSEATREAIFRSDFVVSLVFLADFLRSLVRAPDKADYLKWGWLDFLGSIPAVLPLHLLRLARLARAWRTVRTRNPRQVLGEFQGDRAQGAFLITVLVALIVLTISGVLVLELEAGALESNIDSGDDAFWWAFVTMTTVGYGDRFPVTPWGRVVAMVLMAVGVGIFGVLTSYLASAFVADTQAEWDDHPSVGEDAVAVARDLPDLRSELVAVRTELAAIRTELEAIRNTHEER